MASRRSSWGGAMETYWATPAAARDHVAALVRPSTVCVPVGSARIARGGAQQQGDHDASITPIAGCQPDFGSQSIVGCTDCPAGKHSLHPSRLVLCIAPHSGSVLVFACVQPLSAKRNLASR
jgi:hypothetical protein